MVNFKDFFWSYRSMPQLDGSYAKSAKFSFTKEDAGTLVRAARAKGHSSMIKYQHDPAGLHGKTEVLLCFAPKDHPVWEVYDEFFKIRKSLVSQDVDMAFQ
jgi:hypothetical protein